MKKFIVFVVVVVVLVGGFVWYSTDVPGTSAAAALPPLTDEEEDLRDELQAHVTRLSRDIGVRSNSDPSRVASGFMYVEDELRRTGLQIRREAIQAGGKSGVNLVAELPGTTMAKEIVLVGAHIDSPRASPGADSNASGVAVAIELAQRLASVSSERTLRFVFFSLTQPPFAGTDGQGARQHAAACKEKNEAIVAAFLLEGLGTFSDQPGSQSVPFPFTFSFPGTGNFVAFVGDLATRDFLRQTVAEFRAVSRMPSEGCALPALFPGFSSSDAGAVARAGYPAVLVTGTGTSRNPDFGKPSDTHDRLDYARMARVTSGLQVVVAKFASGRVAAL